MKKIVSILILSLISLSASAYRITNNTDYNMYVYLLCNDNAIWSEHEFELRPGQIIDNPMTNPTTQEFYFKITTADNRPFYLWEGHQYGVWSELVIDTIDSRHVKLTVNGEVI